MIATLITAPLLWVVEGVAGQLARRDALLRTLPPDELAAVEVPTDEEIGEALARGAEEAAAWAKAEPALPWLRGSA